MNYKLYEQRDPDRFFILDPDFYVDSRTNQVIVLDEEAAMILKMKYSNIALWPTEDPVNYTDAI